MQCSQSIRRPSIPSRPLLRQHPKSNRCHPFDARRHARVMPIAEQIPRREIFSGYKPTLVSIIFNSFVEKLVETRCRKSLSGAVCDAWYSLHHNCATRFTFLFVRSIPTDWKGDAKQSCGENSKKLFSNDSQYHCGGFSRWIFTVCSSSVISYTCPNVFQPGAIT